jgi:hypothetical protein
MDYRLQITDYRISGVQNKTGANCLFSLSPLPSLNRSGLKLVCIENNHLPPSHVHLLQKSFYRPQTIDYTLQTTDYRPQTTD